LPIQASNMSNAVWCVVKSLNRCWHTDFDYGLFRIPNLVWPVDICLFLLSDLTSDVSRGPCLSYSLNSLISYRTLWDRWLFVMYAISFLQKTLNWNKKQAKKMCVYCHPTDPIFHSDLKLFIGKFEISRELCQICYYSTNKCMG
jgi:hypothetical protein